MKKEDLSLFDHVKVQFDDDPELEEGAIVSLLSKSAIVAGKDGHKGFWAPIPYEDIIEVIPHYGAGNGDKGGGKPAPKMHKLLEVELAVKTLNPYTHDLGLRKVQIPASELNLGIEDETSGDQDNIRAQAG